MASSGMIRNKNSTKGETSSHGKYEREGQSPESSHEDARKKVSFVTQAPLPASLRIDR